jgi:hypothetical protein
MSMDEEVERYEERELLTDNDTPVEEDDVSDDIAEESDATEDESSCGSPTQSDLDFIVNDDEPISHSSNSYLPESDVDDYVPSSNPSECYIPHGESETDVPSSPPNVNDSTSVHSEAPQEL